MELMPQSNFKYFIFSHDPLYLLHVLIKIQFKRFSDTIDPFCLQKLQMVPAS